MAMTLPFAGAESSRVTAVATPYLSVIVPVYNGGAELRDCLSALMRSRYPREAWELIVIDDGSTDDSALVAAGCADVVMRLPFKPRGPAYARNRGCEIGRGEVLVFIDADVCVHDDVLDRIAALFVSEPALSAAFGSYDAAPRAPGAVSQFRNLLHHFVHQANPGDAETFWSGCGAVRREALLDVQMFDEWHYSRPEIEDIDVGRRLRTAGHRIVLRPEIQCTHLRRWSLRGMVRTDFGNRGVPWMRSLLQERILAEFHTLNVSYKERLCAAFALLAPVIALVAALSESAILGWSALALLAIIFLANVRLYAFLYRRGGIRLLSAGLPLHLLYYLTAALAAIAGAVVHVLMGEPSAPPEVEVQAAVGTVTWPPCPRRPDGHLWRRYA
jgi:glycosyltransferase involved in cell wall biosynthesis